MARPVRGLPLPRWSSGGDGLVSDGRETAYGYEMGYDPKQNDPQTLGSGGRFVLGSMARPEGFEPPTY